MAEELIINVTPQDLTVREVMDLEDTAGVPLARIIDDFKSGQYTARQLAAYAWIVKKREDPSFTFDKATEAKYGDISFGGEEESPPDQAAEGGNGEKQ